MKSRWPASLATLALLIAAAFNGCSPVIFTGATEEEQLSSLKALCEKEGFTQPDAPVTTKLDLLFVVDTSGSLAQERPAIANEVDSFIAALPNNIQQRIAVTLAHSSESNHAAKLFQSGAEPIVLDTETQTVAQIRADLRTKMEDVQADPEIGGGELGLFATHNLMTNGLDLAKSQGFFRDDAALAIIYISDEADICAVDGNGQSISPTPQEVTAFNQDCGGITYQGVYDKIVEVNGSLPLTLAGMIYPMASGGGEMGAGYLEVIALNQGLIADIGTANFSQALNDIGKLTEIRLSVLSEVELTGFEQGFQIDPATIQVYVDEQLAPYTLGENSLLTLDEPGLPGSEVEIHYCSQELVETPIEVASE